MEDKKMDYNAKYEEVTLYRCSCCKEFHTYELPVMENHLTECLANPDNQACIMCKNLKRYNGIVDGRPDTLYKCTKLDKILNEEDMRLTGATCFEERTTGTIEHINSPEYTEYLTNLANKIGLEMD